MGGAKTIPIMFWTTAMGFAKRSTRPAICCLTGCLICPTGKSMTCLFSPVCKNIPLSPSAKSSLQARREIAQYSKGTGSRHSCGKD
jgi:hypothetical protein